MRLDEPYVSKFKRVCMDFLNILLLTKCATPGEFQVTYEHTSVGNKSLGETVNAFALARYLKAPTVVTINAERAFSGARDNIRLPTTNVLLCAAVGNISKSKNLCD